MATFEEIAAGFQLVDQDTRLDLLLDYADKLPPLPTAYESLRDAGMNMVHECQSPVFLRAEVRTTEEGQERVRMIVHVPRKAPTARAFVAILHESFDGVAPEVVTSATDQPLRELGLAALLGPQRTHGLSAVYQQCKKAVAERAYAPLSSEDDA